MSLGAITASIEAKACTLHAATRIYYQQHRPENTLLYQTVQQHLKTFEAQCEAEESPIPAFAKKELEEFLKCGILAYGFARVYCSNCQHDQLLAFSCKRRGFCGSCMARRMNETAAHLVDSVIPQAPTRQWVLSVPAPLRHLISFDSKALKLVLDAYSKTVFGWLKKKAKHRGIIEKASKAHPGAVTFIQRFGSALNLNTHFHSIFSAGIYTENEVGELSFHHLPGPTLEEIREIAAKIAKKVHRWLKQRMQELQENDEFAEREPLLAKCYAASIRYLTAMGPKVGQPLMRVVEGQTQENDRSERTVAGFNLHVSLPIGANDRAGLERQLRYMGRPPLSEERLSKKADGKIVVKLKKSWSDGTSHIVLTPMEFMARLVALIPPPRKNQIRYHGVWAPNARLRSKATPKKAPQEESSEQSSCKAGNKSWAKNMARVFAVDVLKCPKCHSKRQVISWITESQVIKDILNSVGMATAPPEIAKAAFVAEQTEIFYDYAE